MLLHGLDITIERRKGDIRSGVGKDGQRWSVTMPCAYGAIKRTRAADGEQVDAYVGPDRDSNKVWIVDQLDARTGKYDEAKVMLGFDNREQALSNYKKAFSDGRGGARIGAVTELGVDEFKAWLKHGNTKMPLKHGNDASKADSVLESARRYADGGRVGYAEGGWTGEMDTLPAREVVSPVPEWLLNQQRRVSAPDYEMPGAKEMPGPLAFLGDMASLGAEITGVPAAYRSGNAMYEGRPGEAAMEALPIMLGPLGRGAKAAARGVATGLSHVPVGVAVPALGALGVSALPSSAGEPTPAELRNREIEQLKAEIGRYQDSIAQKAKEIGAAKFRGVGEEAGLARQKALEEVARPFNTAIGRAQERISQLRAANDEEQGALVVAERDANKMRRAALNRDKPFNETPIGSVWEQLGPIAPGAVAAGTALLGRLGHGSAAKYLPFIEGTAAGTFAANVPTGWDAFFSPVANPSRKAHQTYGEELKIAQHPRAQEWLDYAKTLPEMNPVREQAQKEFFDPLKAAERMLFGMGEGATGAGIGLASAALLERLGRGVKSAFGSRSPATIEPLPSAPSKAASDLRGLPGTTVAEELPLLGAPASRSRPSPNPTGARQATPGRSPAPEAVASPVAKKGASSRPPWASDAPAGMRLDKNHYWDANLGQQRHVSGTFGETPKYAVSRPKKTKDKSSPKSKEAPEEADDPINRGLRDGGATPWLDSARRYANGGYVHGGLIVGTDGGRADTRPVDVPSGSFVIPADCVAALGKGNTLAGAKELEKQFGKSHTPAMASGGSTPTPIRISDGEYVISPEQVAKLGGGNMDHGHRTLDAFVRKVRAEHIKTLKGLPGPQKD